MSIHNKLADPFNIDSGHVRLKTAFQDPASIYVVSTSIGTRLPEAHAKTAVKRSGLNSSAHRVRNLLHEVMMPSTQSPTQQQSVFGSRFSVVAKYIRYGL